MSRSRSFLFVLCAVCLAALIPASSALAGAKSKPDTARYILPPGNYGGLPFTDNSTDQLPLYSGLTPLRDDVTKSDINDLFLPEDFAPIGDAHEEETGEPGLQLIYDAYGIPHVYGKTRYDVAFGAGWSTARDRQLLLTLGRGPSRAAVADVPNLDAFSLVTSGQSFVPSAATEALVTKQRKLLVSKYGKKGKEIVRDAAAYADGINAYMEANNIDQPPATVNDVIAVTAFIGSIFGAGGGGEAANADLLANLEQELGQEQGYDAWEDVMLADDPEAPTTLKRHFDYGPLTGGKVKGSVVVDPGSIESLDPTVSDSDAAAAPARREASNWLIASRGRSASDNALAVMGPQLGYYYPEIVQQIDLHGPGIQAQGVGVPGLAMYILIGRTKDYGWSLTSASNDVRDVFAEQLCEPDGSAPSRDSDHYLFKGECRPLKSFTAGELNGTPITYDVSVHGSVFATATVDGQPYALSRERSTFGRDGLNLVALHDMTMGEAKTPKRFFKTANEFGFTFNWGYTSRNKTAYFSSGRLPERARGLDRRLPTLGTGDYEWKGFLGWKEHPHGVGGPGGLLLNWNNQAAPGFMHGDDDPYGSVHRVELFDQWPKQARITDNVGIMNRAATEDVRSPVWPVVSKVLHGSDAPNARAQQVVDLLDDWVSRDAPRLDADEDGTYDEAGPTIMDRTWRPIAEAVMEPRFGDLLDELNDVRNLGGLSGESYVDKDLRTLLGEKVRGRYHLRYCGDGDLDACRASLWAAVDASAAELADDFGSDDPASWRGEASTTGFVPGLLPIRFPTTNRPTFQQVLELQHR
ncbi:MAG TPA: penicillin acylase family protein [Solirubrobacterales bacterium]|nr:penicillin acylase family protein [Solirubrobacterales bacterium]